MLFPVGFASVQLNRMWHRLRTFGFIAFSAIFSDDLKLMNMVKLQFGKCHYFHVYQTICLSYNPPPTHPRFHPGKCRLKF